MKIMRISLINILLVSYLLTSCYSFKNVSMSPDLQTFYVGDFELKVQNAPATLDKEFTEDLKDKIRAQSRLELVEIDPDIFYEGAITRYRVTSVAPQPNETTAFNRLEISVKVEFYNAHDEDKDWVQSFSFFADYPADDILTDVQDELIDIIFEQILEDIFNKSFGDW